MVFLIRHCESVFNALGASGRNCGLTDNGIAQAGQLTGNFDILFCSGLKRALDTLKCSGIQYIQLIVTNLCREFMVGPCDFYEDEDISQETEESVLERVKNFNALVKSFETKGFKVGVISHGDFIWYYTSYMKDGIRFGRHLENGEVLEYN